MILWNKLHIEWEQISTDMFQHLVENLDGWKLLGRTDCLLMLIIKCLTSTCRCGIQISYLLTRIIFAPSIMTIQHIYTPWAFSTYAPKLWNLPQVEICEAINIFKGVFTWQVWFD